MSTGAVRSLAGITLVALVAGCAPPPATSERTTVNFADLEARFDARLGVYAIDTGNARVVENRAEERFPYASTHKVFTASAVLARTGELDTVVKYQQRDLVDYSPITAGHYATGMSRRRVLDAALRYSDNTAGNLLFREIGGPQGLGNYLRGLGDTSSLVARIEPALNEAKPGDDRDTSTPRALAHDLRAVVLGDALPPARRALLVDLMRRNRTGDDAIRAGLPAGWTAADKTGTAENSTRNDIAVLYPPKRAPIVLVLLSQRGAPDTDDRLLASATERVLRVLNAV